MSKLSVELNRYFFQEERSSDVTLADILSIAGERVFGFLFVILSLPSVLPIPLPGYSTPLGLAILLLAVQLIAGHEKPWLPEKIKNAQLKLSTVQTVVKAGIPWLNRLEKMTKPRLPYLCTTVLGRSVLGVAIALMAIALILPIPGGNNLPAAGILVIGFSLLEDDGVIAIMGLVLCFLGTLLVTSLVAAFAWGGNSLWEILHGAFSFHTFK